MNELTIKVYDADGSEIAARNVIDGLCANRFHGIWPYQSWGINRQEDAVLTVDFGIPAK